MSRYQRQEILPNIGSAGMQKIRAARVLMVGCGGLGNPVIQTLMGAGIGSLGLCDSDTVSLHNLHRQTLYSPSDIGQKKTAVCARYIQAHNPDVSTQTWDQLSLENGELIQDYDVVVDGSDNFATRYLVNDLCLKYNKPFVSGALSAMEGQVSTFNYQESGTYRCLYPEAPLDAPQCGTTGVWPALPPLVGNYMAWEVLDLVLGHPQLANTLLRLLGSPLKSMHFQFQRDAKAKQLALLELHAQNKSGLTREAAQQLKSKAVLWLDPPIEQPDSFENKFIPGFEDPISLLEEIQQEWVLFACTQGKKSATYAQHPVVLSKVRPYQKVSYLRVD